MNAAATLIQDLAECGVRLSRHADRLRIEAPPGKITPELRLILSERKAELLAALSSDPVRDRLFALADTEAIDRDLVRGLSVADVADCAGLPDSVVRAYLRAASDGNIRARGKQLRDETAPALCRMCGPVWLCPEVAALAPIVLGWSVVLGCPWCANRAKGLPIPRPPVTCGACRHFTRDAVNPDGGLGNCNAGHQFLSNEAMPFPNAQRQCQQFKPINSEG